MVEQVVDQVKEFYYVVNSCQSMNQIYQSEFNETWSDTCKDYEKELLPNL